VRFLIPAMMFIHSGGYLTCCQKQDANPGFINDAWAKVNEPGLYRGNVLNCAQDMDLCHRGYR